MPRFTLEGPRPYTIFCFAPYTMQDYVAKTKALLLVRFLSTEQTIIVLCARSRRKKRTKTYNKEMYGFHNHSPLLTMVLRRNGNSIDASEV